MPIVIFILSFIIRLVYILQLKSTIFYNHFLLDEAFYENWAGDIASGHWLGDKVFDALPLYPYLLGVLYRLFGHNLLIPRMLGVIIGSFSSLLLYHLTRRFFDRRAAIIAGLIASLYGPFIFYSGLLVPATIAVFLYLVALWFLLRATEKPTCLRFSFLGLAIAFAALTRAGILLFVPALLLWLFISFHDKKKAMLWAFALLLSVAAVILPITLRNYIVSGDKILLTSHAGVNFYIGNNEDADGTFKPPQWARSNIEGLGADTKTIAEREEGRVLTDSEVSRFYFNKAMRFITGEPLKFLALLGRKLFLFLNGEELFDVAHYRVYQDYLPILRFPFFTFMLIGPLGLAGIFIATGYRKKTIPLYLFTFSYAISILLYFVNSRYRIPFAMMMIIFAGFFISWWLRKLKEKKYIVQILALCLCLVLGSFISMPTGINTVATGYTNLGNIYMVAKEWDKAVEAFSEAIESDPSDHKPYNDIGYVYIQQNRHKDARRWLELSLSKEPQYPFAHINLGLLHETRNDLISAEKEYKEAIRLNPNIPQAHNNLANIYEKTGRRRLAIEEYKVAIKLDGGNAKTHYNLGVIYGRAGRLSEAKREFEEAVRLDPEFTHARSALRYFE